MPRTSSKLLVDESPLQVLPSLAVAIGINEAIILQQVHFLLQSKGGKVIDGERYVYNSYTGWQQKFFPFWGIKTVQRAFEKLERLGILRQPGENNSRQWRKHHRIDYSKIPHFGESKISQNGESLGQNDESKAGISQNVQRTYIEDNIEVIEGGTVTPAGVNAPHAETVATPTRTPNVSTRRISKPVDVPAEMRAQSAPETDMARLRKAPAVLIYRETFGIMPKYKIALEDISQTVEDMPRWNAVCDEWARRGYRAENIVDLLKVYREGWRTNGKNGTTAPVAPPAPEDIPPDGYEFFYTASGDRKTRKSGPDLLPARLTEQDQLHASYVLAGTVAGGE